MLGLALGFVKTMFGKATNQFDELITSEPDPEPATASQPVTISKGTTIIKTKESGAIKLSVYNPSDTTTFGPADVVDKTVGCFASGGKLDPATATVSRQTIPPRSSRIVGVGFKLLTPDAEADFVCGICTVATAPLTGECIDVRVIVKK